MVMIMKTNTPMKLFLHWYTWEIAKIWREGYQIWYLAANQQSNAECTLQVSTQLHPRSLPGIVLYSGLGGCKYTLYRTFRAANMEPLPMLLEPPDNLNQFNGLSKLYFGRNVFFARGVNHSIDVEFGRQSFQFAILR